jgi:hypothetical protein
MLRKELLALLDGDTSVRTIRGGAGQLLVNATQELTDCTRTVAYLTAKPTGRSQPIQLKSQMLPSVF